MCKALTSRFGHCCQPSQLTDVNHLLWGCRQQTTSEQPAEKLRMSLAFEGTDGRRSSPTNQELPPAGQSQTKPETRLHPTQTQTALLVLSAGSLNSTLVWRVVVVEQGWSNFSEWPWCQEPQSRLQVPDCTKVLSPAHWSLDSIVLTLAAATSQ